MSDFRIDLRVRFAETDAMGVAHHAAYLPYLETARVEYLRALGHPYRRAARPRRHRVRRRGRRPALPRAAALRRRVHASAARWPSAARATFSLAYRVELDGRLVLSGRTRHAVLDRESGAPQRLPEWLAAMPVEAR